MAKLFCSEMYHRVATRPFKSMGIWPDEGVRVERHYRNQKLLDIGEGTSEVQRIVIARQIGVPAEVCKEGLSILIGP